MHLYIEQGRFGEFVTEILLSEKRRKEEAAEKESEDRLWSAYIHSYYEGSYVEWKERMLGRVASETTATSIPIAKRDADMTNEDVDNIINRLFKKG